MVKFPDNFLWGAATSSYQVEGNNTNADWWPWEKKCGHQPSGDACRHYEFFEQDFDIAKELGHNAHRLSIEWSRVEPKQGEFDELQIAHYQAVMKALKDRGIAPMVTLHHFTLPIWLADKGGWTNPVVVDLFTRYAQTMAKAIGGDVPYWTTINEPTIYSSHSYLFGWWPPQHKNIVDVWQVQEHMVAAHVKTYRAIKSIYHHKGWTTPMLGIAHHMTDIIPCGESWLDRWAARLRWRLFNDDILRRIAGQNAMDMIGLNYYSRQLVEVRGVLPHNILGDVCNKGHHPVKKNSLGWDIYPQGIHHVLMNLKKYNVPLYITENGICTDDDTQRWEFIREHLLMVQKAIEEGADVRGYLHWSLLDNFEWDKGFKPRFGLVHIDYQTQQRTIKESAQKYARVCKANEIT